MAHEHPCPAAQVVHQQRQHDKGHGEQHSHLVECAELKVLVAQSPSEWILQRTNGAPAKAFLVGESYAVLRWERCGVPEHVLGVKFQHLLHVDVGAYVHEKHRDEEAQPRHQSWHSILKDHQAHREQEALARVVGVQPPQEDALPVPVPCVFQEPGSDEAHGAHIAGHTPLAVAVFTGLYIRQRRSRLGKPQAALFRIHSGGNDLCGRREEQQA
mmetsp:Transcript_42497/g.98498  ORF Transcript_42497/g.98498 Transcript_42497/m.98498 type:complete len:214 (+) Transcript_42497:1027-1668(+)